MIWILAIPAIVAGGITQINILVGTVIASGAAGAIAIIANADRLYQLPLGIIGIAIGTVLLPELSRHLNAGRDAEARASQSQALLLSMLFSMPAAAALLAIPVPIVRVLFERGAFDANATIAVANTLMAFAIGLPAFVLIRVLQPGFFSRKDTRTPTVLAGLSVIVNIACSIALFPSLQHVGIALATSISAWLNVVGLAILLGRRGHFRLEQRELVQHGLVLVSAALMGAVLALLAWRGANVFASGASFPVQALALGAICLFATILYFTLIHFSGVQSLGGLVRRLRRRRA